MQQEIKEDTLGGIHEAEKTRRMQAKQMELAKKQGMDTNSDEQERKLQAQKKRQAIARKMREDDEYDDAETRHWASRFRA